MANGGSPMPSPRSTPSSMPVMPLPSNPAPTPAQHLLQPHRYGIHRQSADTFTSFATSSQDYFSIPLRSSTRISTYSASPSTPEHYSSHVPNTRPRQALGQHYHNRHSGPLSPPPMRDLPALRTADAEVHRPQSLGEADQLEEGASDFEMIPAGMDTVFGSLYGFPYCMGTPDPLEQRSRDLAEAEELEYQREKSRKRKMRLSGRVESVFKGLSLQDALARRRADR